MVSVAVEMQERFNSGWGVREGFMEEVTCEMDWEDL